MNSPHHRLPPGTSGLDANERLLDGGAITQAGYDAMQATALS